MAKKERMKFSFVLFKVEISEPGTKSIIILVVLLIFLVVLAILLPKVTFVSIALDKLSYSLSSLSRFFKK